jgi:hypothetical protein
MNTYPDDGKNLNSADYWKYITLNNHNYLSDTTAGRHMLRNGDWDFMTSGYGQFHTNEADPENPNKKLKPYDMISWWQIMVLVDNPQEVDKSKAHWVIFSKYQSRNFKQQYENGEYFVIWADLDSNTLLLSKIGEILESKIIGYCRYEIYTTSSAAEDILKARILIPVNAPLTGEEFVMAQEILNDKLEASGITPDRATERSAQLCYLPNRGAVYDSFSSRYGIDTFWPFQEWHLEIILKRDELEARQIHLDLEKAKAQHKRSSLSLNDAPDLIGAFNLAYTVQDILIQAGYDQKGNRFRHPNSQSGSYSATVRQDDQGVWRVNTLSTSDPLYIDGSKSAHDAFSAFEVLFHG